MTKRLILTFVTVLMFSNALTYGYSKENCGVRQVCVESKTIEGHYDSGCVQDTELACTELALLSPHSAPLSLLCPVSSRARCYVPSYTTCIRYENQITCQGETNIIN